MAFEYKPSVVIAAREHLIQQLKSNDSKLTGVGAERIADWLIGDDLLGPVFYAQFVEPEVIPVTHADAENPSGPYSPVGNVQRDPLAIEDSDRGRGAGPDWHR